MDNFSQERIEKARAILAHPGFISKSKADQSRILESLIAKGLRREDLEVLLAENNDTVTQDEISYLENLPYDVFFTIVTSGNISGKHLINLCGTSTTLQSYCNQSKSVRGVEQKQFLFRELLRRMGKQVSPGNDARELYKYYTVTVPKLIRSIRGKIQHYEDFDSLVSVLKGRIIMPPTNIVLFRLYDGKEALISLHYYRPETTSFDLEEDIPALYFLLKNKKTYTPEEYTTQYNDFLRKFNLSYPLNRDDVRRVIRAVSNGVNREKYAELEVAQIFYRQVEAFYHMLIGPRYSYLIPSLEKYDIREFLDHMKKITDENVEAAEQYRKEIERRATSLLKFRQAPTMEQAIIKALESDKINAITKLRAGVLLPYLRSCIPLLKLTDEEIDFIIGIHERVLKGEIQFDAEFTIDGLR